LTREEYFETFIKVQIKNKEHLHVFLKASVEESNRWSADDVRWFEAMYTMPTQYKTDITMEDILEKDAFTKPIPKKLKSTRLPKKKKTHKLSGYEG
jgi:hypothetical protein